MFSNVIDDSKERMLDWRGCQGSVLEEFLDEQDDQERDALLARIDEVGCVGFDQCFGTFVRILGRERTPGDDVLMALDGHETQIIFVRRGNEAIVVDAGRKTENLNMRDLWKSARRLLLKLAQRPHKGEAADGTH